MSIILKRNERKNIWIEEWNDINKEHTGIKTQAIRNIK